MIRWRLAEGDNTQISEVLSMTLAVGLDAVYTSHWVGVTSPAPEFVHPTITKLDFDGNRCEVVKASTDNRAALQAAVDGAQGIYGTTVYNIYAKQHKHLYIRSYCKF